MFKRRSIQLLLILCLLSFPLSAFASGELPTTVTQDAKNIGTNSAMLSGTSTDEGTLQYGFQYGESTEYGNEVKSTDAFAEYVSSLKLGSPKGQSGSGDGEFNYPQDSTIGKEGNIYVVDRYNNRIQIFDSKGNYLSQFSSFEGRNLEWIQGISADDEGNVYVADRVLVKFDADGNWLETFDVNGSLNYVSDVVIDADGNIRILSDSKVMVLSPAGELITTYGRSGGGDGEFYNASSLAIDTAGNTFVTDMNNGKVVRFDNQNRFAGNFVTSGGDGKGNLYGPAGIAIRSDGHIIVSDKYDNHIKEFDNNGVYIKSLLDYEDDISGPDKINIDNDGNLYVANHYKASVDVFMQSDPTNKSFALKAENLDCSTTYHYRSFSTNASGTAYGEDKSFSTETCAPGVESMTITPNAKSVTLQWDEVTNAQRYKLAYRKTGTSTWITKTVRDGVSTDAFGLTPETEYEFRISAIYDNNERGAWSPAQVATTTVQARYNISTCDQLQAIGESRTTHQIGDFDGYYVLTNDIDCSETADWQWDSLEGDGVAVDFGGFKPILDAQFMGPNAKGFRGDLDGAGYTISHIHQSGSFLTGIIGVLQGGTVKDLVVDDLDIKLSTSQGIYGTIAATSDGPSVIDNVVINGSIASVLSEGPIRAAIDYPSAIDFDTKGNVNVLTNRGITKTDSEGNFISEIINNGDVRLSDKSLVSDSDGNFYGVSVNNGSVVLKMSSTGELLSTISSNDISYIADLKIDDHDNLYVADGNNREIIKFDSIGNQLKTIGFEQNSEIQFSNLQGIAVNSSGEVFATDSNYGIFRFDADGNYVDKFAIYTEGNSEQQMLQPSRVDTAPNGDLLILVNSSAVYRYSSSGVYISHNNMRDGSEGDCSDNSFNLAVSANGDIYVACIYNDSVLVFDSSFNFKSKLGTSDAMGFEMQIVGGVIGAPGLIGEKIDESTVGGLTIMNSQSNVDINLEARGNAELVTPVGGLVGYGVDSKLKIYQSSSIGPISFNSSNQGMNVVVGGIGGILSSSEVKDSFTQSAISINGDYGMEITGGIAAQAMVTSIENVYSSGDITSSAVAHGEGRMVSGGSPYIMNVSERSDFVPNPNVNIGIRNSFVTSKVDDGRTSSPQSSIQDMDINQIPSGALGGMIYGAGGDFFKNNAFDATSTGLGQCVGLGFDLQTEDFYNFTDNDCRKVNEDGNNSDYFFGNSTNGPLASWDFENVWKSNPGALPTLRGTAQIEPPIDNGDGGGDLPPEVDNGTSGGSGSTQGGGIEKDKSFSDLVKKKTKQIVLPGVVASDVPSAAATNVPTKEKLANVLGESNSKPEKLEAIGKVKAGNSRSMFPLFVSGMCGLSVLAYAGWFLISRRKNRFVDDTLGPYGC